MDSQSMHYDVYCGVDVEKSSHYMVASRATGDERLVSRSVVRVESEI
jgi:hypothetical protein